MSVFLTKPAKYSRPHKAPPHHLWKDNVAPQSAKAARAPNHADMEMSRGCYVTPARKTSDEC